ELSVKLLGGGLAKLAGKSEPSGGIQKTKSGILVGTPAYMSPEQARAKDVDHRTDIYALGCLSYKLLTGKLPFNADNAMDLIIAQLNQPPPSPAKLAPRTPPQLARTVVRMMAKDAAERPALAEIREVLAPLRNPAAREAPAPAPRRARSVLIGLMLFLSGVITRGVFGIVLQRDPGSQGASPSPAPAPAA